MRSDAIRSDPSHRTHRRRTLLKIITALGSLRSWGTHTHRSATAGIEFRGSFVSRCFYLCSTLPLSPTHSHLLPRCPFRTLSLRHLSFLLLDLGFVLCVVAVSVSVSVSLNRSIWLILLTSFFRLLCSAAFYALYRLFCLDIMAFIYANVIYALSLSDIQINWNKICLLCRDTALKCDPWWPHFHIHFHFHFGRDVKVPHLITLSNVTCLGQQVVRLIDGKGQVTVDRNWFLNWGAVARESFLYNEQMDVNFQFTILYRLFLSSKWSFLIGFAKGIKQFKRNLLQKKPN